MDSNSTTNSTQIAPEAGMTENPFLQGVHIASYSLICLTGVFGNLLVILASCKPGMITVSNILIANLAVADFTVSLINIPTTATYSLLGHWPFGAALCKILLFLLSLGLFGSIGTLVAIAGERYWHIVLYKRRKLTIREAFITIAVIWVSSVIFFLPLLVVTKTSTLIEGDEEVTLCIEEWPNVESRQAFTLLVFLLLYFLPLLLISALYLQIGRFVRHLPTAQAHNQVQTKTIRMLFIVVLLFGLCWLPHHIVILHSEFSKSVAGANHHLMAFCQWLMFANSACNPVVYAVLNKNYRRQFTMILYRRMQSVQVHVAPVENPE